MLHFFKSTATAFAVRISLAGGADGDARRVGRGVVPGQPRGHRFGRKTISRSGVLVVKHHQRIHLRQRPQLGAQGDAVRRGAFVPPVVDGGFNVCDVESGVHVKYMYKKSVLVIIAQKIKTIQIILKRTAHLSIFTPIYTYLVT